MIIIIVLTPVTQMFSDGRLVLHTPDLVYHVEFCVNRLLMSTLSLPLEMRLEPPWQ